MASIEDFVNHRWEDAKEALRNRDSEFVRRIESKVRLDALNLSAPWPIDELGRKPYRRLNKKWHNLLEACAELMMQLSLLEESTAVLAEDNHSNVPVGRAGRQAFSHFRTWFMHAQTLNERACRVVEQSTRIYVDDDITRKEITAQYVGRVREVPAHLNEIRNSFVHANRSWAKGITEDQLWESTIACGLTARRFHDEFVYPEQGELLKLGKYQYFAIGAATIQDRIGLILEEFETSLSSSSAPTSTPLDIR